MADFLFRAKQIFLSSQDKVDAGLPTAIVSIHVFMYSTNSSTEQKQVLKVKLHQVVPLNVADFVSLNFNFVTVHCVNYSI